MKFKKSLLMLGTAATIAAPIATVVSCGSAASSLDNGDVTGKSTVKGSAKAFADAQYEYKVLPTYTGQADQLLSLGIKPDRYPFQLDKTAPFQYITNPAKYMIGQSDAFKTAFAQKLASLMPEDRGTSWWNQQALDAGEKGSDPEYWQHRAGEFTMYEHYLLDDGAKVVETSIAPKHTSGSHTFVQTNFRESRDPFTRLPMKIMKGLLDAGTKDKALDVNDDAFGYNNLSDTDKALVKSMLTAARFVEGVRGADTDETILQWKDSWATAQDAAAFANGGISANPSKLAVDGLPMPSGVPQQSVGENDANGYSWLYNDYFFAKSYHEDFLDNAKFQGSAVNEWIVNKDGKHANRIFDKDGTADNELANLFFAATYTDKEAELAKVAKEAYGVTKVKAPVSPHHPIYEQQEEIGGAPMFEGAQRDNMLYFYNTASKITEAFTPAVAADTQENKNSYDALKTNFKIGEAGEDSRVPLMRAAQGNSAKISTQLRARMANIAKLVEAVKVQNSGKLTFGLVTLAPGEGQTTLQSSSKYSFLYNELGFDQAMPTNLQEIAADPEHNVPADDASKTSFFNMDDNGWWWNLGEGTNVLKNAKFFEGSLDMGLLTANDTQYKNLKGNEKNAIIDMFKAKAVDKVDYNLWNEGLKTPFVMNMMLDKITDMLINKDSTSKITDAEKTAAKNWGTYWTTDFIK